MVLTASRSGAHWRAAAHASQNFGLDKLDVAGVSEVGGDVGAVSGHHVAGVVGTGAWSVTREPRQILETVLARGPVGRP